MVLAHVSRQIQLGKKSLPAKKWWLGPKEPEYKKFTLSLESGLFKEDPSTAT